MPITRQLTLLYCLIAGLLTAIGIVALLIGTGFSNQKHGPPSSVVIQGPIDFSVTESLLVVIMAGLIVIAGLLALAFYWRARSIDAHTAGERTRRQRQEVERTLERLRERMSLPSLFELNRLLLTEYHTIATNQAQKSFKSSQRAMFAGFAWLLACFAAATVAHPLDAKIVVATMAPVGSILAAFLGHTYLYVYDRTLAQLSQYYSQPLLNSYYLAVERLATEISAEARDKWLGDLVDRLLSDARKLSERSARTMPPYRRIRVNIPGMRPAPAGDEDDSLAQAELTTPG